MENQLTYLTHRMQDFNFKSFFNTWNIKKLSKYQQSKLHLIAIKLIIIIEIQNALRTHKITSCKPISLPTQKMASNFKAIKTAKIYFHLK